MGMIADAHTNWLLDGALQCKQHSFFDAFKGEGAGSRSGWREKCVKVNGRKNEEIRNAKKETVLVGSV